MTNSVTGSTTIDEEEIIPSTTLVIGKAHRHRQPRLKLSHARFHDLEELVDLDLKAFATVYANNGIDGDHREHLLRMFRQRYDKIGPSYIPVLKYRGRIVGFLMSVPTEKTPNEFVSWEDTTDNGTLEGAYRPGGRFMYVVTLAMLPEASRRRGQAMLTVDQVGLGVKRGCSGAFFESRVPGLRTWMRRRCIETGTDLASLTGEDKLRLAKEYCELTKEEGGRRVRHDRLLRLYEGLGCQIVRVVPDAYHDAPSMNYGAVCVFDNPLPKALRPIWPVRWCVGTVLQVAAHSQRVVKLFT